MSEQTIPNIKYSIREPYQMRNGAWIGSVMSEDRSTVLYEAVEASKRWAFQTTVLWVMEKTGQEKMSIPQQLLDSFKPPVNPQMPIINIEVEVVKEPEEKKV